MNDLPSRESIRLGLEEWERQRALKRATPNPVPLVIDDADIDGALANIARHRAAKRDKQERTIKEILARPFNVAKLPVEVAKHNRTMLRACLAPRRSGLPGNPGASSRPGDRLHSGGTMVSQDGEEGRNPGRNVVRVAGEAQQVPSRLTVAGTCIAKFRGDMADVQRISRRRLCGRRENDG